MPKQSSTPEEWRPVPGYAGYEASSLGRIRRTIEPYRDGFGYPMITIGRRRVRVHVLVAAAFLGERPPGLHVCHDDGTTTNNRPENLRYDTPSSNTVDALRLDGSTRTGLKATDIPVIRHRVVVGGEATAAVARDYGVHQSTIWRIARRETWGWVD